MACNVFKHGDLYNYSVRLDDKYGKGTAQKLHAQRFTTHKFSRQELEKIIADATEYISTIDKELMV